jgi:hypothetical protein
VLLYDSIKFPGWVNYDRTIVREYGLPRQMCSSEVRQVLAVREAAGKDLIEVTARPYERVMFSLGMHGQPIGDVKGQRILVCGEGASNFAQTLEAKGAEVTAYDRLYATPLKLMAQRHLIYQQVGEDMVSLITPKEMRARLPKRIVGGDIADLRFRDASFDGVFIPIVVYWYLDKRFRDQLGGDAKTYIDTGFKMIDEALRVSKGYVHFNLACLKELPKHVDALVKRYPDVRVIERDNANIRLEHKS